MANCNSCSETISAGERFCSSCGADQAAASISESPQSAPCSCSDCGAGIEPGDRFCIKCGSAVAPMSMATSAATENTCPKCGRTYSGDVRFCEEDGAALGKIEPVQGAATTAQARLGNQLAGYSQSLREQVDGPLGEKIITFIKRHQAMLAITSVAILGWIFVDGVRGIAGDWGYALLAAVTVGLVVAWPVASIRKPGTLKFVGRIDGLIDGLSDSAANSSSRTGRWAIYPVTLLGIGAASLSRFARDPFAAASIRVFCYVLTVAAIVSLIFLAIIFIVLMLMLWAGLWIIGLMLGDEPSTPKIGMPRNSVKKYGRNQNINKGDSWWTEQRAGRVDEDGNIYEGNSWFNEKKVGRVDDKGRIFEGNSWFNEKQIGRADDDGNIYEGDSWFNEQKAGRIDKDGNIYEGNSWFNEKKVGRTEDKS